MRITEQILAGLRYFCVSCALGIGAIYFLMITWFVAWMTIDQRRLEDREAFQKKKFGLKNWLISGLKFPTLRKKSKNL